MKICADAGGTNIRFSYVDDNHSVSNKIKYSIDNFLGGETGFISALNRYLDDSTDFKEAEKKVKHIVVSASGYVNKDTVQFTNSDWIISKELIVSNFSNRFPGIQVHILNDFEALAYGVSTLEHDEYETIYAKKGFGDTSIVCGPGTGLGLAGIKMATGGIDNLIVIPSEGGHQSFPAETSTEREIKEFIMEDWISYENILSGQGLMLLYRYFSNKAKGSDVPEQTPEDIIKLFDSGNPVARKTLEMFSSILGGFCGNMVLALGATKGVYLWGGILKSFPCDLLKSKLVNRFKIRFKASHYPDVPIYRIISNEIALRGCSVYAKKISDQKNDF